jgi:hypothetical protein
MLKKNEKIENINNSMDLINQYNEKLNTLEIKYKLLQQDYNDLLQNLEINKQIIKNFFKNTPFDKKFKEVLSKMQEENKLLYSQIDKLSNENKRLIVTSSKTNIYKNQLEIAKGKIFIFENILNEKENIIKDLNKQLESKINYENEEIKEENNENNENNEKKVKVEKKYIHEIYITEPNVAINNINDTLQIYKEVNLNLSNQIKMLKETLQKKNSDLQKVSLELYNCQKEISEFKQQKNNADIISQLSLNKELSSSKNNRSSFSNTLDNKNNISEMSKKKKSLYDEIERLEGIKKSTKELNEKEFDLTSEWFDTLKHCNMSQEEYVNYCKNKKTQKLTDVIEYLYKYLIDKNLQIKLMDEENEQLNIENLRLNKENIELSEECEKIKKIDGNSTFVNVDNNITHNNININMMLDYMKEVKQTITSSEFVDGIALEQLDFSSDFINANNNNVDNINFNHNYNSCKDIKKKNINRKTHSSNDSKIPFKKNNIKNKKDGINNK